MIINYEKDLLTDVMNKIGLTDLFNKNIPVIIKQDFAVDKYSLIKAGTIGCLQKKESAKCCLTLLTPEKIINLRCEISDKTDSILVHGLKDVVELKELLEAYDGEAAHAIEKYCALQEDYDYFWQRYRKKSDMALFICVISTGIMVLATIMLASYFYVFGSKNPFFIATTVAAVITGAVGVVLDRREFGDTKKGKAMNRERKALAQEICQKDEELCKQYADKEN